jgi:hypothetical protein
MALQNQRRQRVQSRRPLWLQNSEGPTTNRIASQMDWLPQIQQHIGTGK